MTYEQRIEIMKDRARREIAPHSGLTFGQRLIRRYVGTVGWAVTIFVGIHTWGVIL